MRTFTILSTLLALATAHMQLHHPAPFNSSNNPHLGDCNADPYLQIPSVPKPPYPSTAATILTPLLAYHCCGPNDRWTYPCRGYMSLLGTPQGAPTATWQAGSTQTWSIGGIGNHYGGSCQVGFSVDKGVSTTRAIPSARNSWITTSVRANTTQARPSKSPPPTKATAPTAPPAPTPPAKSSPSPSPRTSPRAPKSSPGSGTTASKN